ncbi:MAG TPA: WhiB family transcriptional regulator [Acidimicrobiales bacterium]|nr:WhiB family transcriptional regulator [Acidimicrobiales bacterium]
MIVSSSAAHVAPTLIDGLDWRQRAACRLMPADLFFPVGTSGAAVEEVAAAKRVCGGCEVSGPCLEFALATRQEFGVWGGLDEDARRQRLRSARRARTV